RIDSTRSRAGPPLWCELRAGSSTTDELRSPGEENRQVPGRSLRLAAPDRRSNEGALVEPGRSAAVYAEGVRLGVRHQLRSPARAALNPSSGGLEHGRQAF